MAVAACQLSGLPGLKNLASVPVFASLPGSARPGQRERRCNAASKRAWLHWGCSRKARTSSEEGSPSGFDSASTMSRATASRSPLARSRCQRYRQRSSGNRWRQERMELGPGFAPRAFDQVLQWGAPGPLLSVGATGAWQPAHPFAAQEHHQPVVVKPHRGLPIGRGEPSGSPRSCWGKAPAAAGCVGADLSPDGLISCRYAICVLTVGAVWRSAAATAAVSTRTTGQIGDRCGGWQRWGGGGRTRCNGRCSTQRPPQRLPSHGRCPLVVWPWTAQSVERIRGAAMTRCPVQASGCNSSPSGAVNQLGAPRQAAHRRTEGR